MYAYMRITVCRFLSFDAFRIPSGCGGARHAAASHGVQYGVCLHIVEKWGF